MRALFRPFKKQLKTLLMMRLADEDFVPTQEELQEHLEGAPASWLLGRRAFRGVDSVQLTWPLRISELRSTAQRASDNKGVVSLECPCVSAPLGGMSWSMRVQARWVAEQQATRLGLYCIPGNAPSDVWYRFGAEFDVDGAPQLSRIFTRSRVLAKKAGRGGFGVPNFFAAGMSGGWDEAAWVAAGLPAAGELRVTLTVLATNNAGYMA